MWSRYWFRWLSVQGVPRLALRGYARRGDLLARLFAAPASRTDPYPLLETIRARGPLVPTTIAWVTADHELCRNILRDNTFGVRPPESFDVPRPLRTVAGLATLPPNPVQPPSMLIIDPPEHTRMRKQVASTFTPRATARLRDRVDSVTAELLAALPENGRVDLIADFAAQVPIAIISEMLGFPDETRDTFLHWGDDISPMLDIGLSWRVYRRATAAIRRMDHYLDGHLARLRRDPGEDILSSLVVAGALDDDELKATASLLMGAGFETTVNLIGNGVAQLLAHPEQLQLLRAEPDRWPNAIEEILRFDPAVQSTARTALADTEIAGNQVRRGHTVVLSLAGANRDPRVFAEPNRFDITRSTAKDHLTFSSGIHACLGASLARMEATHALRALFEHFPDLRLAAPPERRPMFTLRGYRRMPVLLGRRVEQKATVGPVS